MSETGQALDQRGGEFRRLLWIWIAFASVMLTNVTIILGEEFMGEFASPNILAVLGANASWVIVPILLIWRMWDAEHPFTKPTTE